MHNVFNGVGDKLYRKRLILIEDNGEFKIGQIDPALKR